MHEVLISYSKKDKKWAGAACSALEARGIRCWIAPRNIAPGTEWGEAVIAGIDASKVMLLVFSASANESRRVRREVERAISKELPVVACRIEDVKPAGAMKHALSNARRLDIFEPPVEVQLKRLADSVQALLRPRVPKSAGRPPIPDVAAVQRNDAGEGAVRAARWRGKQGLVAAAGCALLLLLAASLTFVFWPRPRAASAPKELEVASNGQTASPAAAASEPQVPENPPGSRRIEIKEVEPHDASAASPNSESERRADRPAHPDDGGTPRPDDQRTAADRPAKNGNGGAPVAGNGGGQGRLTGEDLVLLKAASNWYYDNQERIISDPWFDQSLDFIVKEAQSPQPRSTLARVMLVRRQLMESASESPKERADMIRHLPKPILELAVTQAMEELTTSPKDVDLGNYHGFVENAVFFGVEKMMGMMQRNETNKYKFAIVINQATSNIAKNVERLYGPKLSTTVLDRQTFRGRLEYRDEVDFENKRNANGGQYPGGSLGIIAKYIALEYRGDTELTNVLLIGRLKTTGIVRELEPEQRSSLHMDYAAGVASDDVVALKLALNMFDSMPAAVFNYIPKLAPGTTSRMLVSGIDNERYVAGGSATLYCDQGYLPEMEVNKFGFTAKKADGANPLAKGSVWEGDLFHSDGGPTPQWRNPDKCRLIITDRDGDRFKGKILGVFKREEIAGRIVSHEIKWKDPGDRKVKGDSPVSFAGKITGDRMEVVGKRLQTSSAATKLPTQRNRFGTLQGAYHGNPRNWPQYKLVLQYTGAQP